jgi:hypothetical protein
MDAAAFAVNATGWDALGVLFPPGVAPVHVVAAPPDDDLGADGWLSQWRDNGNPPWEGILQQQRAEHADLQRLVDEHGNLWMCDPERCPHKNCLLRVYTLRYGWLLRTAREAARLRRATTTTDVINVRRQHGGGQKHGAQLASERATARDKSEMLGGGSASAVGSESATSSGADGGADRFAFEDEPGGEDPHDFEGDDETFLYSKAVARVAREQFVVQTIAHMHDPDFVPGGVVCRDTMRAILYVSRDYLEACDKHRALRLTDPKIVASERSLK